MRSKKMSQEMQELTETVRRLLPREKQRQLILREVCRIQAERPIETGTGTSEEEFE
jgi:hypothetical protein